MNLSAPNAPTRQHHRRMTESTSTLHMISKSIAQPKSFKDVCGQVRRFCEPRDMHGELVVHTRGGVLTGSGGDPPRGRTPADAASPAATPGAVVPEAVPWTLSLPPVLPPPPLLPPSCWGCVRDCAGDGGGGPPIMSAPTSAAA